MIQLSLVSNNRPLPRAVETSSLAEAHGVAVLRASKGANVVNTVLSLCKIPVSTISVRSASNVFARCCCAPAEEEDDGETVVADDDSSKISAAIMTHDKCRTTARNVEDC